LTSHYNPNVASLAKIFSEPFRRQGYVLEDFLDHSYIGMMEAEMAVKRMKKVPVISFEKPAETMGGEEGNIVGKLWSFE
jgi:U3 small nucleolar RNA-associated protein 19